MNHLYNPVIIRLPPGVFSSLPPIFAHILQILMKKVHSTITYFVIVVTVHVKERKWTELNVRVWQGRASSDHGRM
jgi:hypothetical protein